MHLSFLGTQYGISQTRLGRIGILRNPLYLYPPVLFYTSSDSRMPWTPLRAVCSCDGINDRCCYIAEVATTRGLSVNEIT